MSAAPTSHDLVRLVDAESEDPSALGRLRSAAKLAADLAEAGDATLTHFVDEARAARHSWSQIGEALGVSKQAAQQRRAVRPPSDPGAALTPRARRSVEMATGFARDRGDGEPHAGDLLLALARDRHGLAARILADAGLDSERAIVAPPPGSDSPEATLDAILSAAHEAAGELTHDHLGTEHLLLGVARADRATGGLLEDAGLGRDALTAAVKTKVAEFSSTV